MKGFVPGMIGGVICMIWTVTVFISGAVFGSVITREYKHNSNNEEVK